MQPPNIISQQPDNFRHLREFLPSIIESANPERAALRQVARDLLNWQECLRRCNPAFAKSLIFRLRENDAIDNEGATILIRRLKLEAA